MQLGYEFQSTITIFLPYFRSKQTQIAEPVRDESGGEAALESDLGGFGGGDRGKVCVCSEKEVPVDQEPSAGATVTGAGYSGCGRSFAAENGALRPLRLARPLAETPRLSQTHHYFLLLKNTHQNEWILYRAPSSALYLLDLQEEEE